MIEERKRDNAQRKRDNALAAEKEGAETASGEYNSLGASKQLTVDQSILLYNIKSFIKSPMGANKPEFKKCLNLSGSPAGVLNKLMLTKGSFDFIEMKPHEISELVPMIRIFKVLYDKNGDIEQEIEFKFPTRVDRSPHNSWENMLDDTTDSGVGIKSFEYKYVGSNPATIRNDIEAKLVLYFQNFSEMLRPRFASDGKTQYAYLDLFDRARKLKEASHVDEYLQPLQSDPYQQSDAYPVEVSNSSINVEGKKIPIDCVSSELPARRAYDPVEFEIKAEIGWAWEGSANTLISKEKIEAVKNARQSLFLTLIDHDFTFEDDGTFSLELNYRARLSGVLVSPKCDILGLESWDTMHYKEVSVPKWLSRRLGDENVTMINGTVTEIVAEYRRLIKKLEGCCNVDEELSSLKDDYGKFMDSLRGHKFKTIMSTMLKNRAVYTFGIPLATMKAFADIEASNELLSVSDISAGYNPIDQTDDAATVDAAAANTQTAMDDWRKMMTEPKTIKSLGNYPMTFFYLGDLIDLVTQLTLSEENLSSAGKDTLVSPEVAKRIKVVLGTMDMKDPHSSNRSVQVPLADIPISYQNWRNFWYKRVISTRRETYSFLHFIRDVVRDLVVDTLNSPYYTDNSRVKHQKLQLRTAYVSLPSKSEADTGSQAAVDMLGISGLTVQDADLAPATTIDPLEQWMVMNNNFHYDYGGLEAKTVDMDAITESSPLSLMNASKSIKSMHHYLIVYIENGAMTHMSKSSIPENKSRKKYDREYGIHHFGFGEDRGIFRTATFAKTDQPFLREARYMEDGYNPFQQLSNVYDVSIGLFGAPFFYPGQYVWVSPFGLSKSDNANYRLGSPDVGPPTGQRASCGGSYAYLMGLGGYHIITEVHGILMDGQYHTNIKARYDNSGADSGQRQGFGFQDEVSGCDEDE